jgi:hypothetical protein
MGTTPKLYVDDFYAWTEVQASELRKLAGRPELSNAIDWENVIEEIETLGRNEVSGVESNLARAIEHVVKAYCDPDSLSILSWRKETKVFLRNARKVYRRSMRRMIDIESVWREAVEAAFDALEGYILHAPPGVPKACPFAMDQLLDERFSFDLAVSHLHATRGGNAAFEFPASSVQ